MPNCDFLATGSDFELVLSHVFAAERFLVYEHYSPYDQEVVQFRSVEEVRDRYPTMGQCIGSGPSVMLQLLVPGTGSVLFERISLDSRRCGGVTFRYRASGWGLIQLQLGGIGPKGLVESHTNHNSAKRAAVWEATCGDKLGPAASWDWPQIESASRSFNRYISKIALRKDGSRPVLPEAAKLGGAQMSDLAIDTDVLAAGFHRPAVRRSFLG